MRNLRKSIFRPFIYSILLFLLLATSIICTPYTIRAASRLADVTVGIDASSPTGISQFSPAITHVDNTLNYPWHNNNLDAVNRVRSLIQNAIPYQNTHIMAWGSTDPWPDPAQQEPGDWSILDSRLQLAIHTGSTPILTLNEAPWWMKGKLRADGTTALLTAGDEWSTIAYESRILDNKMPFWLHLVQRVAERYMAPPYNVRYFQIWNELKGYYNPGTNLYDYTTDPGDPSKPAATHGYTYMYNQVYSTLIQVATRLGIPLASIKTGGPYVVVDTWSSSYQSNPSNLVKAYGVFDQRSLDIIKYWLQNKASAGFITIDGSNKNRDNSIRASAFSSSEKFADITTWIRSLDPHLYPGSTTLPIWFAEWYVSPYLNTADVHYINALKTYAMMKFIKAGGALAMSWGGVRDNVAFGDLWTTTSNGGGQPEPWYFSYKAFKDYFTPGTMIYKTTISMLDSVEALASASKIMLVNKTPASLVLRVNGAVVSLLPYQVSVINYP